MRRASRWIYIGVMSLAGVALACASRIWPIVNDGPVPPVMTLLIVSLLVDFSILSAAKRGALDPLPTVGRIIGFFAGALLYLFTRGVLPSLG